MRGTCKFRGFGHVTQPLDCYFSLGQVELRAARGRFRFGQSCMHMARYTCASRPNPRLCRSLSLACLRKPLDRINVEQRGRSGEPTRACSGVCCHPLKKQPQPMFMHPSLRLRTLQRPAVARAKLERCLPPLIITYTGIPVI